MPADLAVPLMCFAGACRRCTYSC